MRANLDNFSLSSFLLNGDFLKIYDKMLYFKDDSYESRQYSFCRNKGEAW